MRGSGRGHLCPRPHPHPNPNQGLRALDRRPAPPQRRGLRPASRTRTRARARTTTLTTTLTLTLILPLTQAGQPGSPLKLDLVYNPGGAFLPPSQVRDRDRARPSYPPRRLGPGIGLGLPNPSQVRDRDRLTPTPTPSRICCRGSIPRSCAITSASCSMNSSRSPTCRHPPSQD